MVGFSIDTPANRGNQLPTKQGKGDVMNPQRIIDAALKCAKTDNARNSIENIEWAPAYSEPGYQAPKRGGIYFANWNDETRYEGNEFIVDDRTMGRLASVLERYGADIQWRDEWSRCAECGNAIRTSPDSYGWQPAYFMTEDGEVCHKCVAADPEEYLRELEGSDTRAWTLDIDPADHGYTLLEDGFESGFHPGQDDDPREIAAGLRERGIDNFVFRVDSVGQFDASFSVYIPTQEETDNA
jgi:hypothetical protein